MTRVLDDRGVGQPLSSAVATGRGTAEPGPAAPPPAPPPGISALGALNALLRRWRVLVVVPLLAAAIAALVAMRLTPTFRATAIFVPEASGGTDLPAGLAGMAGQFGLSLGGGSRSAEFYAEVAKSRDLLAPLLRTRFPDYRTRSVGDSATLLAQLEVEADSGAEMDRGLEALGRQLALDVDLPTSLVSVTVTSEHPGLAADVANRLVALVDEFNRTTRRSQASRRREFIEERVAEAAASLRAAEGRLDAFYVRNRAWQQSPALVSEEGRLNRAVNLHQETFLTLSRSLEQARIEQVDNAPVISVIQTAVAPRYRSHPRRTVMVLVAGVLGVALAVGWIAVAESLAALRAADSPAYRELAARLRLRRAVRPAER